MLEMDLKEIMDMKNHNDTHTNITYIKSCLEEVEKQCEILDRMRLEAEQKVSDYNKDDEIVRLQEKIVNLCRQYSTGFNPSPEQWEKIAKWQEKHIKRKHRVRINPNESRKYIPGLVSFSYEFTDTHLGRMGTVICDECKEKAFKKSMGIKELYKKYMEDKDAEYFIGEV